MPPSAEYWAGRFERLERESTQTAQGYAKELQKAYQEATKATNDEILKWYQRFADNNNMTLPDAKKILRAGELAEFKWTAEEYAARARDNVTSQAWTKQLENASARAHVTRLEDLNMRVRNQVETLHARQVDGMTGLFGDRVADSYLRAAFEVERGTGVGHRVTPRASAEIDAVLRKPWTADGRTFSDRLWTNKTSLIERLETGITQSIMRGGSPDALTQQIADEYGVSYYQARRLVMTEQAYFNAAGTLKSYQDLGVEMYDIVATLDTRTSIVCQELDGKVERVTDYRPGVTAPPFHPNCRTTTAPHFDDLEGYGERAARDPDTGKTYTVAGSIKYDEWKRQFVITPPTVTPSPAPVSPAPVITPAPIPTPTLANNVARVELETKTKKLAAALDKNDYNELITQISEHDNEDIRALYLHADETLATTRTRKTGEYSYVDNTVKFNFPSARNVSRGMDKFSIVYHEHGHFFDSKLSYSGLTFNENSAIRSATTFANSQFLDEASSSDEFLAALRKDQADISAKLTTGNIKDLISTDATDGVQDIINGMTDLRGLRWGHGKKYWERKYSYVQLVGEQFELQEVYNDLGMDASTLKKTQRIARDYDIASEAWANISAAEAVGGKAREYMKQYFPNLYAAFLDIISRLL